MTTMTDLESPLPSASPTPRPRPGRVSRFVWMGAALLACAVAITLAARFQREPPPAKAAAPGMIVGKDNVALQPDAPQWKVLRLGAAQAATAHYTDPLPARVLIDEARVSRLGAPLSGRVSAVFVERGQKVKAGQPLFQVVSPGIAEMHAERDKTEVDLAVAKANLERVKAVVAAHAIPAKEQLLAEQDYRQAQVASRLAADKESALKVTTGKNNDFAVLAPRDGVVTEKTVSVGQNVSSDAGDPLMVVADLTEVWVVAELFEADATDIKAGTAAQVTTPSLPGETIDAKVEMVSQVVDPQRHTIPIRVRVINKDDALRPNVYAQVRFFTPPPQNGVEVAAGAVLTDGHTSYVYLQDSQGKFSRHDVVAGSVRDGKVVVTSGLKPGDSVVEEGGVLLDNQIDISN